jgi:uncharacterized membrane protein YkvA (DUF1232 family)
VFVSRKPAICNPNALLYGALEPTRSPVHRRREEPVSEHIAALAKWAVGWRSDLEVLERALSAEKAPAVIRRYAAAALNYVVSRMDLVPDWEPVVGLFDDLMVVRICAAQGLEAMGPPSKDDDGDGGGLDRAVTTELGRLANQAERVHDFLGDELFAKLRAYCDRLTGQAVRGRTPEQLLGDAKAREQLFAEVKDASSRANDLTVTDEDQAAVRLKAYLGHKLK